LQKLDDQKAAQQNAERGHDLYEELVAQHPGVPEYRRDLAISCGNLGSCLRSQKDWEGARRVFERSRELWQDLATQHADVASYRQGVAHAHANLGTLLRDMGRGEEAEDAYRRALALGAHAEVVAAVGEQVKDADGPTLYRWARLCALAAAAVKDDAKLREQYTAQAVDLLQRAAAAGFLNAQRMKEDQDLAVLRSREDFQKLLRGIEKK
jgi:tetratricopeptide (TPR) repeat protein